MLLKSLLIKDCAMWSSSPTFWLGNSASSGSGHVIHKLAPPVPRETSLPTEIHQEASLWINKASFCLNNHLCVFFFSSLFFSSLPLKIMRSSIGAWSHEFYPPPSNATPLPAINQVYKNQSQPPPPGIEEGKKNKSFASFGMIIRRETMQEMFTHRAPG